jgi:hypothetical protein
MVQPKVTSVEWLEGAYKVGKSLAAAYSRGVGFKGIQEHFESFCSG